MYYKEFLRVRKVFIGFAIALVCIAVLVLSFAGHVHGSVSMHPSSARHAMVAAASVTDQSNEPNVGVQIHGDSDTAPLELLFGMAGFVAGIFALVLACALAADNHGHLEIAWTRPASRTSYALRTMLVDWLGILAIFIFALVLVAAVVKLEGWSHYVHTDSATTAISLRMFAFPFAWYGLVSALTASLRAGAGLVAGLSWPVASLSIVLEKLLLHHSVLGNILGVINYINPLLYTSFSDTESGGSSTIQAMVGGASGAIVALACIALGGIAISLLQWRRLEA